MPAPQKRLIEALARTFGVPPAFFFDDYDEHASLLQDQVELLAVVRDACIGSAQLRAILELSPQARQAITDLVQATARDDTRRHCGDQVAEPGACAVLDPHRHTQAVGSASPRRG